MFTSNAEELARLTAAEADAEIRYTEAVKRGEVSAVRSAADAWKRAADAVTDFVLKYPPPCRVGARLVELPKVSMNVPAADDPVQFPAESVRFNTLQNVELAAIYRGSRYLVIVTAQALQDEFGAQSATAAELERIFRANEPKILSVISRKLGRSPGNCIVGTSDFALGHEK